MSKKKYGLNTICTHTGEVKDQQYKGSVSPIFMATSYEYEGVEIKRYPRYFNTPNQIELVKKIAALEKAEDAMIFGSGMAALSTMFMAFLKKGDHVVVQNTLYGGTRNFIKEEFPKYGIDFTFTDGYAVEDFQKAIKLNTRLIHIETPSNPTLTITDIRGVAKLAKERDILTSIDNTFASPINQNPIDMGIDLVMHSATKYLGGHSDILAGAVAGSKEHIEQLWHSAINYGGSLSDMMVWLLERSIKTLGLRVTKQNENAQYLAEYLHANSNVEQVYYPGLKTHPEHELAKSQMSGFGGMLSFELKPDIDSSKFMESLNLIKPSMSLAGVESTMLAPHLTSHALLTQEERDNLNIRDGLIRFSVGIEHAEDLIADIDQALIAVKGMKMPAKIKN